MSAVALDYTFSNGSSGGISMFNIVAGIIIIVLIIVVIVIIIGAISGNGEFDEPDVGPCITRYCDDLGESIVTRKCIPNKTSGRGCKHPNGSISFEPLIEEKPCYGVCKSSVWSFEEEGPSSTLIRCIPHDLRGINECTYQWVEGSSIPRGCWLNGNRVVCSVGTSIVQYDEY
jgi:hypothetical protein